MIADLSNNQISSGAWFFLTSYDGYDGIVTMTGVGHRSVEDITNADYGNPQYESILWHG